MSAPAYGATDILGLGADWEPQGSEGSESRSPLRAGSSNGDFSAETAITPTQTGTARYIYIGAETGMIAALAAANALPGQIVATNTLTILSVAIDYSPCAAGERPLVTFSFRDGPTAAPATPFWYTSALTLPTYTAANVLVPTLLTVTAGSAECVSAQWSLACQMGQTNDKDGDFLAGQCYGGLETVNLSFVGVPTSITSTGWVVTQNVASGISNTSNADYPPTAYKFERKVARSTGA
jgi:hypothetical protein